MPPRKIKSPFADTAVPQRVGRQPINQPHVDAQVAEELARMQEAQEPAVQPGLPSRRRTLKDGTERVPFGRHRMRLPVAPPREGYHRRWFNDTPGRVALAQAAGYDFVKKENGENFAHAGGMVDGKAVMMYLMEMPQEWRDEDFEALQDTLNAKEQLLYRGKYNEEPGDKRYVPYATPIKISVERGPGRG